MKKGGQPSWKSSTSCCSRYHSKVSCKVQTSGRHDFGNGAPNVGLPIRRAVEVAAGMKCRWNDDDYTVCHGWSTIKPVATGATYVGPVEPVLYDRNTYQGGTSRPAANGMELFSFPFFWTFEIDSPELYQHLIRFGIGIVRSLRIKVEVSKRAILQCPKGEIY